MTTWYKEILFHHVLGPILTCTLIWSFWYLHCYCVCMAEICLKTNILLWVQTYFDSKDDVHAVSCIHQGRKREPTVNTRFLLPVLVTRVTLFRDTPFPTHRFILLPCHILYLVVKVKVTLYLVTKARKAS